MPENRRTSVAFDEILAELKRLSGRGLSGTLFITTNDNHSARFVLDGGRLMGLSYRHLHGHDAVPEIRKMKVGSFRFEEERYPGAKELPAPDSRDFLKLLNGDSQTQTAGGGAIDSLLAKVRMALTIHLGPVAAVLCERYIEDHGRPADANALLAMTLCLAGEIDDPAQREQFKAQARETVNKADLYPGHSTGFL